MVAGVTAPYDTGGNETGDLLYNSWPRRPGEGMGQPLPREFNTTCSHYGVNVNCHAGAGGAYKGPSQPAGTSKRISASYQKTGVLSHRAEEGFRDTKAACTLTEVPPQGNDFHYGTMRQSLRDSRNVALAGSMVLHGGQRGGSPARSMRSGRSGRSNRSQVSQARSQGGASQGGASRRSQTSSISRQSHASQLPGWYQENRGPAWSFEPLPMYERTNESYGRVNKANFRGLDHSTHIAAGKSESGWLEPNDLIKTLTRPNPGGY